MPRLLLPVSDHEIAWPGNCPLRQVPTDYLKYHTFQTVPAHFDTFGDSLENKEDGLTDIINFHEQKFGVSQHSEIVRNLKDFYTAVLK